MTPAGIDAAARLGMLADGLREAGVAWSTHAHMDVWPIFSSLQLKRFAADLEAFADDLRTTRELVQAGGDLPAPARDAIAGVEQLEQLARGDARTTRAGLRRLGTDSVALAHRIEAALPPAALDTAELAASRRALFSGLGDGAADIGSRRARELLSTLPPAITGPYARQYLGVATNTHAREFVQTLQKMARLEASTAERERLGMIELLGRGTPEAAQRLRGIMLDLVSMDPKDLAPAGWRRIAALLELDANGSILDGPRALGGSARSFQETAERIGGAIPGSAKASFGSATRRYFEGWRANLAAHMGVDGQPVRPAGTDPNAERIFQVREPEPLQLVEDLGNVGDSNFAGITTALEFVQRRLATVREQVPAELVGTLDDTGAMTERNLRRLRGELSDSYGRHPDYAELGRVRTNMRTVELVLEQQAATRAGASVPPPMVDRTEVVRW